MMGRARLGGDRQRPRQSTSLRLNNRKSNGNGDGHGSRCSMKLSFGILEMFVSGRRRYAEVGAHLPVRTASSDQLEACDLTRCESGRRHGRPLGQGGIHGGLQTSMNQLASGASLASVALNIIQSPEAQDHLSPKIEAGFHLV